MPSRISSLLAAWLYSDMASTPTAWPSLRMLRASMPCSSARSMAARNTRSLLSGTRGAVAVVGPSGHPWPPTAALQGTSVPPARRPVLDRLTVYVQTRGVRTYSVCRRGGTAMQVITQDRYGSADVLSVAEVERPGPARPGPRPGPRGGRQCARLARHARRAVPRPPDARLAPSGQARRGVDVAGTVEAIGPASSASPSATRSSAGASAPSPTTPWPSRTSSCQAEGITFEQAAAIPTSATTAWRGLTASRPGPGRPAGADRRCLGRRGQLRGPDRQGPGRPCHGRVQHPQRGPVRAFGADAVIDYTHQDRSPGPPATTSSWSSPARLAAALPPGADRDRHPGPVVGRRRRVARSARPDGHGGRARGSSGRSRGPRGHDRPGRAPGGPRPRRDGRRDALMDRSFTLAEAAEAIRYVETGHTQGKSVVVV